MTAHKHAEVIKAWADGALIEGRNLNCPGDNWYTYHPTTSTPGWYEDYEYRIQPARVFPKTSLRLDQLEYIFEESRFSRLSQVLEDLANQVIKRHILDQEAKK